MSTDGSDRSARHSSSGGKTLSKRLLYLPLVAYELSTAGDGEKSGDPAAYLDNRKSLPSSVQEKALVNFWHKVGVEYHQNQATVRDPKNNGNRPISLRDLEDRIRQRALTLVGGGINSDWATSTGSAAATGVGGQHAALSAQDKGERTNKKKRKRSRSDMSFIASRDTGGRIVSQFLQDLNALWNDYIYQLFQLQPPLSSLKNHDAFVSMTTYYSTLTNSTSFWVRVTSCISNGNAQLMGAKVRIEACRHSPTWVGRMGYLVGSTSATWILMVEGNAKKKKRRRGKNQASPVYESGSSTRIVEEKQNREQCWKSIVVPKRGSAIALLIPLPADRNGDTRDGATAQPARKDLRMKDNTNMRLPLADDTSIDTNQAKPPFLVIHLEET